MYTFVEFDEATRWQGAMDVTLQSELDAIKDGLRDWEKPGSNAQQMAALTRILTSCTQHLERVVSRRGSSPATMQIEVVRREATSELKHLRARLHWKSALALQGLRQHGLAGAIHDAKIQDHMDKLLKMAKLVAVPQVTVGGVEVKAQPLQPEVWRELFDPHHRTSWSTASSYREWMQKVDPDSRTYDPNVHESFFQYLDRIEDSARRQQVMFMNGAVRDAYEVTIQDGLVYSKGSGGGARPFSSVGIGINDKRKSKEECRRWANWVMSPDKRLFSSAAGTMGVKPDGSTWFAYIHHSSYLEGGPILCGGEWKVEAGSVRVINCMSGHYKPTNKQLRAAMDVLVEKGLSLKDTVVDWLVDDYSDYARFKAADLVKPNVHLEHGQWPTTVGLRTRIPDQRGRDRYAPMGAGV